MATTLSFDETMDGFLTVGAPSATVGYAEGKDQDGARAGVAITISIDDLDSFIAYRDHEARVTGRLTGQVYGSASIESGTFNLFNQGADGSRHMRYMLRFRWRGQRYELRGQKNLDHRPFTLDEAQGLTTLYTEVYPLDAEGAVAAGCRPHSAGILRFELSNLPALLASVKTGGSGRSWVAKARFLGFFLSEEAGVWVRGWKDRPVELRRRSLVSPRSELAGRYDVVVVGSGYGGGVVASRLAAAAAGGRPRTVCLLERGKEWRAGEFPDEPWELPHALRTRQNPDGLFDVTLARDRDDGIDVLVGNGLGGTSLINANVMIQPARDVFQLKGGDGRGWPADLPELDAYYADARRMLHVGPHPELPLKGECLQKAAAATPEAPEVGQLDLAITFADADRAEQGLHQAACNGCGGCVTGCNFNAKNTVDMTYLAMAQARGARIFAQLEVQSVERLPAGGGYRLHLRDTSQGGAPRQLEASQVVLAAGALGSFGILARSVKAHGLEVSNALGTAFSGNGDILGMGYNTHEETRVTEGPTITSVARYGQGDPPGPGGRRFIIEEGGIPRALASVVREGLPLLKPVGEATHHGWLDGLREWLREAADEVGLESLGALQHSLLYLGMGFEQVLGTLQLDETGRPRVSWKDVANQAFAATIDDEMKAITEQVKGTYIDNPRSRSLLGKDLITVHPLGGCPMGDTPATGVVNSRGEVFGQPGLFVADGSIFPAPVGVNPALTIAALAGHIADGITAGWAA
jgi:cholesterol oxidase